MFTIFLRRLQKYFLPIKIAFLLPSVYGLYFLVANTPPELLNIVLVALLLAIILSIVLSFVLPVRFYLPIGVSVPFLLFLKAVDLLTPINVFVFIIFITLVELYLIQLTPKVKDREPRNLPGLHIKPLFPKGWISGVGKRKV